LRAGTIACRPIACQRRFFPKKHRCFRQYFSPELHFVYVDGTFKQAPPLFSQIFVIMGKLNFFLFIFFFIGKCENHVFPLLYCLLPNKQRRTYERLFRAIAAMCPQFQPDSVAVDFEIAVVQAAQVSIYFLFFYIFLFF
jgi:hypothetical protein